MPKPRGHIATLTPFEKTYTGDQALSSRPLAVKVPQQVDTAIRNLPNKSEWLRRVITEAAQAEGLV